MLRITWLHKGREGQVDLLNTAIFNSTFGPEEYEHESWIGRNVVRSFCIIRHSTNSVELDYDSTKNVKYNHHNHLDAGILEISRNIADLDSLKVIWKQKNQKDYTPKPQPLIESLFPKLI